MRYAQAALADADRSSPPSDSELAGRLAAGDRAAEAELFRRLAPRVRLYGLRHLRDPAAADDLVQDVLLMTFDRLRAGRVRDVDQIASFVLGICRRVVAGLRRGADRRQRLLERHAFELAPGPAVDRPSLDLDRLCHCLERLAERERTVVVLSFYADRRSEEIGRELAMSAGNVRVVRHRALSRLRECMEAEA